MNIDYGVNGMLDEVLYMQMRILRLFCKKFHYPSKDANCIFKQNGIWDYIEECYDTLHLSGDEYVLNDIEEILRAQGVLL